ncbi:MAG: HAD hydrolase-like protein, partial [Pseudomonadota bacterium]
ETVAAEHPGARIALFAAAPLADHARALGLRPVDEGPQIVLLARDTGLTYDRLQRLVAHVHGGLPFFVANPDATHPDAQGRPVPETGALLQAVRSCVPDAAPRVIGKPDITLIETALRRAAARADEAVFIGDNPGTDGLGATRAGLDFIRVGPAGTPGTRRLADLLAVEAPDPALAARR